MTAAQRRRRLGALPSRRAHPRVLCWLLCVLAASPHRARNPPRRRPFPPAQLQAAIDKLGDLDYATRTDASRTVRRTAGGAGGSGAAAGASPSTRDGYVRYRALVLLTGFNDPRTSDAMRESLPSPNDRLRTVAYSFFEHNPDRAMFRSC